MEVNFKWY